MSLETALTEEPLPNGADAAQHAASKPQLNSQSINLMSLNIPDCGETPASQSQEEVDADSQGDSTLPQLDPRPESEPEPEPEADPQILEALRSAKDRLFVLKLGESMESLIQDRHTRNRVELTPASTYHKLLVHRCAAYYKLTPETEAGSKAIAIIVVTESRIPARRVADLVPPDDSPLPAFKIMRRTPLDRTRHKSSSQGGSGNDDNTAGDMSDGDPSETGSSRGSRRKPLTMSERQAQYDEARSRIFKDLEEKEKTKAQDMSASSSTLSLLSVGSSSGGAGEGGASSLEESLDETGSVDRDWGPGKDKTDGGRRTGSAASGSRRTTAPPFNGHGHSPGFNYPTLYEPAPAASTSSSSSYESSPSSGSSAQAPYQPTLYPVYQYGAPAYLAPFPYPYYPYGHPHTHVPPPPHQPPSQHPPDSSAASANGSPGSSPADAYPPSMTFVNQYVWGPPPPPPPPHLHHQPPQQQSHPSQTHPPHAHPQPTQSQQTQGPPRPAPEYPHPHPQFPQVPMHAYTYPPPGPGFMQPLPPQVQYPPNGGRSQPQGPLPDPHRPPNPTMNHVNGTASQPQLFHTGSYGPGQGSNTGGGSPVRNGGGAPPKRMQARSGWSYGPGVSGPSAGIVGETVGPRMSVGRRTSGGNGTASGTGNRTPGDETASTTSSSTSSSSSRQTFTSNSSKHPLPPRPDWAVGLKPQPTLHHSTSHHSSPRSHHGHLPSQSHSHHHSQQRPPLSMPLQSNDFPPLPVSPPNAEKRPVLGGVWAGPTTTRSILGPSLSRLNNGAGLNGSVHGNGNSVLSGEGTQQNTRLEEHDRAFERPGPKAGGELFNPNGAGVGGGAGTGGPRNGTKSPPNGAARKAHAPLEKERVDKASARGEAIANAILVDRVAVMRIGPEGGEDQGVPKNVAAVVGEGTAI